MAEVRASPFAAAQSGGAEPATVAAVVLNWRQPRLALDACADLLACGHPGLRVFLRDNGSRDDSAEVLAAGVRRLDPGGGRIHLDLGGDNLGFAGGVNRGLRWAAAAELEQVLLANNDVRVGPGVVTALSEVLRCDPAVGAVGPTLLRPDGKVWAQGGALRRCANLVVLRDQGRAPADPTSGPRAVDFVPGAFAMCRTADLIALGGLEESYFMYWEDVDLGMRLRQRGLGSVWLPWVRASHQGGGSSGGSRSGMRKYMQAANSVRFLRRHGRWHWWLALAVFDGLLAPVAILRDPRTGWAKVRGLWFGLRGGQLSAADVERWVAPAGSGDSELG